ncbi:MAG: response regulator [Flavobacteriaceae bacterium]|nr:response regulator [Flavobacteriaceae bacterium]
MHILFFLCAWTVVQAVFCQDDLRFNTLGTENGLSNGSVTAIAQDSIGFIWIATKNGLNRYDGKNFKVYTRQNSNISSNDVSDILIDNKGRIWIGTIGGGISRYDIESDTFVIYCKSDTKGKFASNIVHSLYQDSSGHIWAATNNGLGLFDEKGDEFQKYYIQGNSDYDLIDILCIYEDLKGRIWIGSNGNGLYQFKPNLKEFSKVTTSNEYSLRIPDYILDITSTVSGKLLLGTGGNGLVGFDAQTKKVFEPWSWIGTPEPSIVRTFWKDDALNIWMGTDGDGLFKFNKEVQFEARFTKVNNLPGTLVNNTINDIFEDRQGNIWIGTAWRGLSVWKKETENLKHYYSDGIGFDSDPILSLYKNNGSLWMGLDGQGLNVLNMDTKNITRFDKESSVNVESNFVQCIRPSGKDQYWLGTFTNGLILFDKNKGVVKKYKRSETDQNSLPFDDVRDVIVEPSGNLWIATWGGGLSYFKVEDQAFQNYRFSDLYSNSLSSNNVISLMDDGSNLWIGTHGGGLNMYDKEKQEFTHHKNIEGDTKSLGSNYIFSILKGEKDIIWLGTKNGLSKYDKTSGTFSNYNIGDNLNSNTVVSLIRDAAGLLWLGTKRGIFMFDPDDGIPLPIPETKTEFHINSAFMDNDGIAYFGGIKGITAAYTNMQLRKGNDVKIVFTDFKLFNQSQKVEKGTVLSRNIAINNKLELKHNQNVITFGLAALKFPFSRDYDFEVMMEGFEENWRSIGEQSSLTYTNLSPGTYLLKARLANAEINGGNENVKSMQITIAPPLWKTNWAYFLYALTFLAIIWGIRYYTFKWAEIKNNLRTEKLKREKEDEVHHLKQRFFTNISHEIRTPLTLIMGTLNSLKGNFNANEQTKINAVRHSASRLMTLVNELLNIRKLETGNIKLQVSQNNLVTFLHEIFLAFSQQAISKDIEYIFTSENKTILVWFDKVQLEKTIYNLLTNAFKFTPQKGRIEVLVGGKNNFAKILVKDTGTGIAEEKLPHIFNRFYQNEEATDGQIGFGIGLSIVKDIIGLHHGTIKASSKLGHGSTFKIRLPMGKDHFESSQLNFEYTDVEHTGTRSFSEGLEKHSLVSNKEIVVLAVEDNKYLRDFLSDLLSSEYKVITAENGKKGLDLALEHLPDLILSDIMMPEMDGVTLCYTLKTNLLTSHIPVILLTARDMVESIMEGYETGADDYLIKPFHEGVLRTRIKNLLKGRQRLRDRYSKELLLNPKEIALNSPDQQFLEKLQKVLEDKMANPEFHINELAFDMAMSHSGIYKKIKALTGMTLVGFIKDFRLKRAAQILKQHDFAIADVSFMVGYTDRKHFSQEFKKKFGINPSEYGKDLD